jgi:hypothetical protein
VTIGNINAYHSLRPSTFENLFLSFSTKKRLKLSFFADLLLNDYPSITCARFSLGHSLSLPLLASLGNKEGQKRSINKDYFEILFL